MMDILTVLYEVPLAYILLALIAVLLYIYSTWTYSTWSNQGIRGPYPVPFFGTMPEIVIKGGFYHSDLDLKRRFGKVIGLYAGRVPSLGVSDPDILKEAMVKQFPSMPNRATIPSGGLFNLFLSALRDDHWRHVRASLTPTFTTGKLKQMKSLIDQCAGRLSQHLEESKQEPFDCKSFCGCYTMDVLSNTAFGIDIDSQKNPGHPVLLNSQRFIGNFEAKSKVEKILFYVHMFIFLTTPNAFQKPLIRLGLSPVNPEAFQFFATLCEEILSQRQTDDYTDSHRKDFVQICRDNLVDDPKPGNSDYRVDDKGEPWSLKGLTRNEVIANSIIFFVAGYQTVTIALSFMFYELAMNPDVQEKVYEEIAKFCPDGNTDYENLSSLKYVDMVIEETLRLYPPAPRVDRAVSEDVEINGIHVPAGSSVIVMIYALHHDSNVYPDPDKFDPERFNAENKASRHPYAYMPFGMGNRNCIGMRLALLELKIALVKVLTKFELKRCPMTSPKPIKLKTGFQLDMAKPNYLVAEPRA